MSKRVALTTTSPASVSPIDGVGDVSCPRATSGAIVNQIPTSQSPRQFFFHITSFLHFFSRGGLVWRSRMVHDSHSSFCEEVFSRAACRKSAVIDHRYSAHARMRWTGQLFWLLAFGSEKL